MNMYNKCFDKKVTTLSSQKNNVIPNNIMPLTLVILNPAGNYMFKVKNKK